VAGACIASRVTNVSNIIEESEAGTMAVTGQYLGFGGSGFRNEVQGFKV
jgi:hypothetical protein